MLNDGNTLANEWADKVVAVSRGMLRSVSGCFDLVDVFATLDDRRLLGLDGRLPIKEYCIQLFRSRILCRWLVKTL